MKAQLIEKVKEARLRQEHRVHSNSSDQARASSSTSLSDRMPTIERPFSHFFLH